MKIAYVASEGWGYNFLNYIVPGLNKRGYENAEGYPLDDSDIIWLEWCNETTIKFMRDYRELCQNKLVVMRLHSYEAFTNFIYLVDWGLVDHLIFVADHVRNLVFNKIPGALSHTQIHLVPNAIDFDKFTYDSTKKKGGKF